jgi:hypothetical protein
MRVLVELTCCFLSVLAFAAGARAADIHHYMFFNRDRERIADPTFLNVKALEGAQLKYTWRELERRRDQYDFGDIQRDFMFLKSKGKKLFIQLQDASFDTNMVPVPRYVLEDARYHGGADLQYTIEGDNEEQLFPKAGSPAVGIRRCRRDSTNFSWRWAISSTDSLRESTSLRRRSILARAGSCFPEALPQTFIATQY